ncbi:MAG TPA: YdcF family protein [Candidatus Obscuribacterales bacterium]
MTRKPLTSASLMVVLGRGASSQSDRALAAAQLFQEQPIDIFVSGMGDAQPILKTLTEMGVPTNHLDGERCSQTTWENGLFTDFLIDSPTKDAILLVTDEPHLLRAALVFKSFGFEVSPYALPTRTADLFSLTQAGVVVREYVALADYAIGGKLQPKSDEALQADFQVAEQKIQDWGCAL